MTNRKLQFVYRHGNTEYLDLIDSGLVESQSELDTMSEDDVYELVFSVSGQWGFPTDVNFIDELMVQ